MISRMWHGKVPTQKARAYRESIRAFAGVAAETAKYYAEDKEFLLEFEAKAVHYEVVSRSER